MEFYIRVYIKFRFLFRDIAKEDRTYKVKLPGFQFDRVESPVPKDAKVLFDKHGVKVNLW